MVVRAILLGLRRLARHTGFSIPAFTTLILSLATVTAVYIPLESIVLRPLPYQQPDRLVRLWIEVPGLGEDQLWGVSKAAYSHFESANSIASLGLYRFDSMALDGEGPDLVGNLHVTVARASHQLFQVLAAPPILGRTMSATDNLAASTVPVPSAWLSYRLWQEHFAGSQDVLGRAVELEGAAYEIAGVLAEDGRLPEEIQDSSFSVDIWTGLPLGPSSPRFGSHVYRAIGRLHAESSAELASAELLRLVTTLPSAAPTVYSDKFLRQTSLRPAVEPLLGDILGDTGQFLWLTFGSVLLVLVMAFANVSNLLLAYSESRRHEVAVRSALGATPLRAALPLMIDVLWLAFLSTTAAVLLAQWAVRGSLAFVNPEILPRLEEVHLHPSGVLICLVLALLMTVPVGWLAMAGRRGLGDGLRRTGAVRTSLRALVIRRILVVGQIGISVTLLAASLLLIQTSANLQDVDPGFDPERVVNLSLVLPSSDFPEFDSVGAVYQRLVEQAASISGIEEASVAAHVPLAGVDGCSAVYVAGRPIVEGEASPCVLVFLISPGYFEALDIPVHGRAMTWADQATRAPVAIISQALSRRLWPDRKPQSVLSEGMRTNPHSDPYRIVGVAGDIAAEDLSQPASEILYLPLVAAREDQTWGPIHQITLVVRTQSSSPLSFVPSIREAIQLVVPRAAITEVRGMRGIVTNSVARTALLTRLFGLASIVAFILGSAGIYSVLAFLISRRRSEIGMRIALGAEHRQIHYMILGESMRLAGWGIIAGLVSALLLGGRIQDWLFGISGRDPGVLIAVSALVLLTVIAASIVPARRASKVSISELLRQD